MVTTCVVPGAAQTPEPDYGGLEVTRSALEALLEQYEAAAGSGVYGEEFSEQARISANQIRERLRQGDFRVGDRIVLQVLGQEQTSDTLVVENGGEISLVGLGGISLMGVLRSELQDHLTREIGRFIRDPVVRTTSLIRVSVQGLVGRPGFYVVPATSLLEDVIMHAGGPAGNADLSKVRIERAGEVLLEGEVIQAAFTEGRSVDQLNLRAGDQILVPALSTFSIWRELGRYALIILPSLLLGRGLR